MSLIEKVGKFQMLVSKLPKVKPLPASVLRAQKLAAKFDEKFSKQAQNQGLSKEQRALLGQAISLMKQMGVDESVSKPLQDALSFNKVDPAAINVAVQKAQSANPTVAGGKGQQLKSIISQIFPSGGEAAAPQKAPGGKVEGKIDPAVQKALGVESDGWLGPETRKALDAFKVNKKNPGMTDAQVFSMLRGEQAGPDLGPAQQNLEQQTLNPYGRQNVPNAEEAAREEQERARGGNPLKNAPRYTPKT